MRFAEEIVDPRLRSRPRAAQAQRPGDQDGRLARGGPAHEFDPAAYEDTYRQAVLKLVEPKAAGKNIELPEPEETQPADDLLAQLEASLSA